MTNKEKLKNAIDKDINTNNYYDKIIEKIERVEKTKHKNNIYKLSFVPICLLTIIVGRLLLLPQNKNDNRGNSENNTGMENYPYFDISNDTILNINNLNNISSKNYESLDSNIKIETAKSYFNIPYPFKDKVDIPKDLTDNFIRIVHIKDSKATGNYIIEYTNGSDRTISVSYCKDAEPLKNYYFSDEESKITIINGIKLKIYKYKDILITEFKYNDYNFNIETSAITEQELFQFLLSILK